MALHFCEECGNLCSEKYPIGNDEYLWDRKHVKSAEKWYSILWWRFLRTSLFWTDLALLFVGVVTFHNKIHPLI